jgi:cytochrome P450
MSYVPFSAGRRICLGQYMGEMSVKLITLNAAKYFEIK